MTEPLRIGILGAAGIARQAVVPAIGRSRNARVVAVATRNVAAASEWARAAGIKKVHASYEALLADPEIEAVYIPLPNSEHARWTIAAAKAGKAVLCEKPIALNAQEAAATIEACAEYQVVLMEAFMYRFHPQHRRVREIISMNVIGEVVEVQAHLSVNIMSPADPSNVRFKTELGGGALLDMGCYGVHIARSVFGEEPVSVTAHQSMHERFGVDVSTEAILEFSSNRVAVISSSFQGSGQGFYRVIGQRGMIEVPRGIIPGLGDRVPETLVILVDENGSRREELIDAVDQYQLMIERFADAVRGRCVPDLDSDDPIRNMRVLDAIATSARTRRSITMRT